MDFVLGTNLVSLLCCVRGDLECLLGEHGRAVASYSDALRRDPQNFFALIARGMARFRTGDARSLEDCHRAVRLQPDNYRAYYYRWRVRSAFGDPGAAHADLARACVLAGPCERFWLRQMASLGLRPSRFGQ
jgi:tetratricopeptide (TPR) repeat protein